VRDIGTIDSERRLLAAVRRTYPRAWRRAVKSACRRTARRTQRAGRIRTRNVADSGRRVYVTLPHSMHVEWPALVCAGQALCNYSLREGKTL
jgi:hypothetical protein